MSIVHAPVKASELRPGDVIRIGTSENYILAFEVTRAGSEVAVWSADGGKRAECGPSLRLKAGAKALVSRRGCTPVGGVR